MPARIEAGDIHSIAAFRGNYTTCQVPPNQGLLHHYRRRFPGAVADQHKAKEKGYVSDRYLLKFAPQIVSKVDKVLKGMEKFRLPVYRGYD